MAVIWGPKTDGKTGAMTEDDVLAFIIAGAGKGNKIWENNVRKCAQYISNHRGAGGGSQLTHRGNMVFHTTEGAGSDHVAMFFTCANGNIASIIGVGKHAFGNNKTWYNLDWHLLGWNVTRQIGWGPK